MPEINQKYNVKAAVGKNNIFDMSRQVVTTSDFGRIKPIYLRYCVPGDKITKCQVREFTRLMPMPSPTFGHIESITRAFFVPMRSIFSEFNEFLTQTPVYHGSTSYKPQIPRIKIGSLRQIFINNFCDSGTLSNYDIAAYNSSTSDIAYYKFSERGRLIYDLLVSLGLNIDFKSYGDSSYSISVMPIVAFYRAYFDWIVPSRFLTSYPLLRQALHVIAYESSYGSANFISDSTLVNLLSALPFSYLDNDIFCNSFDSPAGNSRLGTVDFSYTSPLTGDEVSGVATQDSNRVQFANLHSSVDTDYLSLMTLGRLQNMLNRGMLAGSKIQDYLYSTFGIKPNTDIINISHYIGSHRHDIQISDVVSYADTSSDGGASLGQFAGKGIGSGSSDFDFEVKEHGYYLVTNEIIPRPSYYQGVATEFDQLENYDFYQPEFDNVGVEAVPVRRLCANDDSITHPDSLVKGNEVFGWLPRYAQLKTSFDCVSGDFRVNSRNKGLDSWYFARKFLLFKSPDNKPYLTVSNEFCQANCNSPVNPFDKIFQNTLSEYDHFYSIFYIDCKMSRPMKSISDFALEDDIDSDHKTVSVKNNGNIQ